MDIYLIVLRWLHILAGVYWVGATFLIAGFLEPAIRATNPDGAKVMQHLLGKTKYLPTMIIASITTVVAGVLLYWRVSSGLSSSWLSSGTGIGLTIGAIAGLIAGVIGSSIGKTLIRIRAISREIQAQGGPPNPQQMGEMQQLRERLRVGGQVNSAFMVIAVTGMAVAQYLWF